MCPPGYLRTDLIDSSQTQTAEWLVPSGEQQGLRRYVQTIRERFKLIVLTVLVTTLAAALYVGTAEKTFEARATLLVTPVPRDNATLATLGEITASSDPTRDVTTAAALITTIDVGRAAKEQLRTDRSPRSLLKDVEAEPIAQSNLVAVTAKGSSAVSAQNLANTVAEAAVEVRTQKFHDQVDKRIAALEPRVRTIQEVPGAAADPLRVELAGLRTLRAGDNPTLRVDTRADKPTSPSWPKRNLSLFAGFVAGLVLGVGGAFALTTLDPRLRREEQLRELYQLPVLARIPKESKARTMQRGARRWRGLGPRRRERRALGPRELSPSTLESYRALRAVLLAGAVDSVEGRSVMVTGASPSEGKTTTAINLASSLALAGNRVILIEGDFRRPTVAEALGVTPTHGIGRVLLGTVALEDALSPVPPFGDSLRVLLVRRADELLAELLSLPIGKRILEDAKALADFVIVDSPPLTEVVDALPFARNVDDLIIVCRMGWSRLQQLNRLNDLLYENGIQPTGFALVGVGTSERSSYYISGQRERMASQPSVRERTGEPAP